MSAFAKGVLKKVQEKPGNSLTSKGSIDMNLSHLMALLLAGLLTGCGESPKPATELTCKDSPTGRSKAEQTLIADACFRQGSFKKSSGMEW